MLTKEFIIREKCLPDRNNEYLLLKWLRAQFNAVRAGMSISPDKKERLEEILHLIRTYELPVPGKLTYIKAASYTRAAPSPSLENSLGNLTKHNGQKSVSRSQESRLSRGWLDTFARLAIFRVQQQRWPVGKSDQAEEEKLAAWCHNMRHHYHFSVLGNKRLTYLSGINFPFEEEN